MGKSTFGHLSTTPVIDANLRSLPCDESWNPSTTTMAGDPSYYTPSKKPWVIWVMDKNCWVCKNIGPSTWILNIWWFSIAGTTYQRVPFNNLKVASSRAASRCTIGKTWENIQKDMQNLSGCLRRILYKWGAVFHICVRLQVPCQPSPCHKNQRRLSSPQKIRYRSTATILVTSYLLISPTACNVFPYRSLILDLKRSACESSLSRHGFLDQVNPQHGAENHRKPILHAPLRCGPGAQAWAVKSNERSHNVQLIEPAEKRVEPVEASPWGCSWGLAIPRPSKYPKQMVNVYKIMKWIAWLVHFQGYLEGLESRSVDNHDSFYPSGIYNPIIMDIFPHLKNGKLPQALTLTSLNLLAPNPRKELHSLEPQFWMDLSRFPDAVLLNDIQFVQERHKQ